MEDEQIVIKFTEKGKKLNAEIQKAFEEWLKCSEMTEKELLDHKNVKGFHIVEDDDGFYLAYYEGEKEKHIGAGLYKSQRNEAQWLFGYICALLDSGNDYKSDFSKEYLKWGAKNE